MMRSIFAVCIVFSITISTAAQDPPDRAVVTKALHESVTFFRQHASAGGGYVFQLSADLSQREGEGKVTSTTAWIEPPATPAVGMAYLDGYRMCGEPILMEAAKETADALVRGQLRSGGWDNKIEFDPQKRKGYAYRFQPSDNRNGFNVTTFDDDKSQSATRFLVQLDKELEFKNGHLHNAAQFALDGILKAQYSCGAWPQRFGGEIDDHDSSIQRATFPSAWSRTHPKKNYSQYYTINDNTISDLITTLLDAWDVYDDVRYLNAAQCGGEFLLRAQLPEPQPGWAQQYNRKMQPAWARRFEPPAITGGESQGVMRTLIMVYRRTAAVDKDADRFLEPLPRAIRYYRRSLLPDGQLARFYEIGTNRPLYFTKQYELTYDDSDLPTHYGFITGSALDSIEQAWKAAQQTPKGQLDKSRKSGLNQTRPMDAEVAKIVAALDSRGAWVEPGRLKHHGDGDPTREVIRSATFSSNIGRLAEWLAANDESFLER